jgi:adenylate cyclase
MGPARARTRRRQLAAIIAVAATVSPVFNVLTSRATVAEAVQGVVDATLVGLLVGVFLLFVRDGAARGWFQRLGFRTDLILSSAVVLALFLVGRAAGQVVTSLEPHRFPASFVDPHLRYALPFFAVLAVAVLFVLQMNRMIGANALGYFMAGTYQRPTSEERLFLFVDLTGSTQLAERLGSARYFELLRRFVDDLTEPVLETGGDIYQYAGDEVVMTWPLETGLRGANCVRCFFLIRDAVAAGAARYEREFGARPAFRGGLHGGVVTAGELGDVKQQIVFTGDILNTAARLEEYAKHTGFDQVVSGAVLDRLTLPAGITAAPCGDLALRGKEASVSAYGLTRSERAA